MFSFLDKESVSTESKIVFNQQSYFLKWEAEESWIK